MKQVEESKDAKEKKLKEKEEDEVTREEKE